MPQPPPARPCKTLPVLLLALTLVLPAPALAWWPCFNELGLGVFSHADVDLKNNSLRGLGLTAHAAAPLWASDLLRLDLRLQATASGYSEYRSGAEVTLAPGLRLYLPPPGTWFLAPFAEAGLGLSWCDLHIPELGSRINFLSFFGLGARFPLTPQTSLDLAYRVRHISNAGLDDNNHGLTSHLLALEVAWLF